MNIVSFYKDTKCGLNMHSYKHVDTVTGSKSKGVQLVTCLHCGAKFLMNDHTQKILRIDNDRSIKNMLALVYKHIDPVWLERSV